MDYTSFKTIASTQDWLALLPEITLCVSGLLLLLLDVLLSPKLNKWIPRLGVLFNLVVVASLFCTAAPCPICDGPQEYFNGMIHMTATSQWFRAFFILSNLAVFWLAGNYLKERKLVRTEFYAISSIVTAAMMLLMQSNHFVVLFVALETITVGLYVLVAYDRNSEFSLESGIKYLVVGGTNTAILLLGIALLYGIGGNSALAGSSADPLSFANLREFLLLNDTNTVARMGVLAVLASVAFKVGLVPFQIWIPDVYQGAPTPTTAFLSVSSKAAGFGVLLILFSANGVFTPMVGFLTPILLVVTIVSLIYGNVVALGYTNLKRLLGMSGVSHAGFLMIGVMVYLSQGSISWIGGALLFYLFAYLLASYLVFGVMSVVGNSNDAEQDIYDYTHFGEKRPVLAAFLSVGVGSLAGIPPLVGFMAKFSLFVAAFQSEFYLLLAVAAVSVAISIYYYFKWIREVYIRENVIQLDDDEPEEEKEVAGANVLNLIIFSVLAAAVLLLGIFPMNLLSSWSFL